MTRADPLFRYAGTADIQQLRFRLDYPRKLNAEDRRALARRWNLMSPEDRDAAARAVGALARFIERTATDRRHVPHVLVWLRDGGHHVDWTQRTEPLTGLGRCMWNIGGAVYPLEPQCAADAAYVLAGGRHYCERHARAAGVKVRAKVAA